MNAEQLLRSLSVSSACFRLEEPLCLHTSFRIGGPADAFLTSDDPEILSGTIRAARAAGVPTFVLGRGTNVLFDDRGFRGIVFSTAGFRDLSVEGELLSAGAGATLSACTAAARDAGLSGMEFSYGIPGSVGGAVCMNAGAYGGEIGELLTESECLDPESGEICTLGRAAHRFSYRHSCYQENGLIVLRARFRLVSGDRETIRQAMDEIMARRVSKQPLEYPSAGSTFKRPEGHFAGQLIEDAGMKGSRVGGAQVSEKHAGFIINRGGATAADVRQLMQQVQEAVLARSGVLLEPEVICLPERGV